MNHLLRRTAMVAGAMGLAMTVSMEPALAAASSSVWVNTGTPKTRAGEALFNRSNGTHGNKAWFDVNDTKCDASPVYVEYSINANNVKTAYSSGGCGTSKGINLQTGRFAISYRVCVDGTLWDNPCSQWRGDNN
jgi:hypothetical protein